jgi:hypothetical protein
MSVAPEVVGGCYLRTRPTAASSCTRMADGDRKSPTRPTARPVYMIVMNHLFRLFAASSPRRPRSRSTAAAATATPTLPPHTLGPSAARSGRRHVVRRRRLRRRKLAWGTAQERVARERWLGNGWLGDRNWRRERRRRGTGGSAVGRDRCYLQSCANPAGTCSWHASAASDHLNCCTDR